MPDIQNGLEDSRRLKHRRRILEVQWKLIWFLMPICSNEKLSSSLLNTACYILKYITGNGSSTFFLILTWSNLPFCDTSRQLQWWHLALLRSIWDSLTRFGPDWTIQRVARRATTSGDVQKRYYRVDTSDKEVWLRKTRWHCPDVTFPFLSMFTEEQKFD